MVKSVGNRDENFTYSPAWILDRILSSTPNVKRVAVEEGVKSGRFGVADNEEHSVPVAVISCNRVGLASADVDWSVVGTTGGGSEEAIVWGTGISAVDSFSSMTRLHVVSIIGVIELMHALTKSSTAWFVDVEGWMSVEGDCTFLLLLGLVAISMYNNK